MSRLVELQAAGERRWDAQPAEEAWKKELFVQRRLTVPCYAQWLHRHVLSSRSQGREWAGKRTQRQLTAPQIPELQA